MAFLLDLEMRSKSLSNFNMKKLLPKCDVLNIVYIELVCFFKKYALAIIAFLKKILRVYGIFAYHCFFAVFGIFHRLRRSRCSDLLSL